VLAGALLQQYRNGRGTRLAGCGVTVEQLIVSGTL
jgi:hypothetical protein